MIRYQTIVAVALIAMHVGIGLLMGYPYVLWWPVLAAGAWSSFGSGRA